MKILYFVYWKSSDYQGTLLLHGLYQIDNIEVYLQHDAPWLFDDFSGNAKENYGKGFNISKIVDSSKRHVHTQNEINENIKNHWYDLVIYGTSWKETPLLELVSENYKKNEIFFIDGSDEDFGLRKNYISLHGILKKMLPIWYFPLNMIANMKKYKNIGLYFKREISNIYKGKFIPIAFAFPEELFVENPEELKKNRIMAYIYPGKLSTYIYDDEESYNKGYRVSRFGTTFKKAGWDCYRHYEILANGCIPYFPDIDRCPTETMFLFPKDIIKITNRLYKKWIRYGFSDEDEKVYRFYQKLLFDYAKKNLTTRKLAEYVLSYAYK